MSRTAKNLISLGVIFFVLACIYVSILVFDLSPKLGLDLQGGISLVYEAKGKVDPGVLEKTVEKIRDRVDQMGVAEPDITMQGNNNVVVQMPGIHDPDRAKQLVGKTAQLQFRIVQETKPAEEVKDDPNWQVTEVESLKPENTIVLPYQEGEGEKEEKTLLRLGETLMTGDVVEKAVVAYDEQGAPKVNFELTGEGKGQFGDITTQNQGKQLAIVLDYVVESAPNIKEPITDGRGEITGDFTDSEAKDLSIVLNTGALPVELELINEQDVTATLGKDSLRQGLMAGLVGLLVVALFMLAYYRALGIITCLALAVFGALMYGSISVLGEFWSLTLAGIAGIIVAIGIAADSSIVYFERLKEELKEGRSMRVSADRAYKSAFRTILAADTVSFAAAAILYIFSVGSVKGFAFTLGMATLFDVFISYFFTRPFTSLLANWRTFGRPISTGVKPVEQPESGGGS